MLANRLGQGLKESPRGLLLLVKKSPMDATGCSIDLEAEAEFLRIALQIHRSKSAPITQRHPAHFLVCELDHQPYRYPYR